MYSLVVKLARCENLRAISDHVVALNSVLQKWQVGDLTPQNGTLLGGRIFIEVSKLKQDHWDKSYSNMTGVHMKRKIWTQRQTRTWGECRVVIGALLPQAEDLQEARREAWNPLLPS